MLLLFQQSLRLLSAMWPVGKPLEFKGCRSSSKNEQTGSLQGLLGLAHQSGKYVKHAALAHLVPAFTGDSQR